MCYIQLHTTSTVSNFNDNDKRSVWCAFGWDIWMPSRQSTLTDSATPVWTSHPTKNWVQTWVTESVTVLRLGGIHIPKAVLFTSIFIRILSVKIKNFFSVNICRSMKSSSWTAVLKGVTSYRSLLPSQPGQSDLTRWLSLQWIEHIYARVIFSNRTLTATFQPSIVHQLTSTIFVKIEQQSFCTVLSVIPK